MMTMVLAGVAGAATVDFVCTPGTDTAIVGLPPLTVSCDILPPDEGSYEQTTWTFGDGTVLSGDSVTFTYDEVGQYTVTGRIEGYLAPGAMDPVDVQRTRTSFVTVCGTPEPAFRFENLGGLDYRFVNESTIAPRCLDSSRWSMYAGREASGEPLYESAVWEPELVVPAEGTYTVRLEHSGIGGAAIEDRILEAEYQLADRMKELNVMACATSPAGAGWLSAALLATLLRRRRGP